MRCLLVSHNAGGAAYLAAWAAHQDQTYVFDCLISGPAVGVFCQRLNRAYVIARDSVVLSCYDCVITSTSAAETGWETVWIAHAKEQKIKTISLLDHWTNYASRFMLHDDYVFPDELWVCDDYALALARTCRQQINNYPPVQKIPNFYLMDQVEYILHCRVELQEEKNENSVKNTKRILFVSEPSYNPLYSATSVLESLLQLVLQENNAPQIVRLRLHPREQVEDYIQVCSSWQAQITIELSPNTRLEDDLCWATWVVGCQTMAMVVALAAGINVASCLPACVKSSALPHKEIPRLFPPKDQ